MASSGPYISATLPSVYFGSDGLGAGRSYTTPMLDGGIDRRQSAQTGTVRVMDPYGERQDAEARQRIFTAQIPYMNFADMTAISEASIMMVRESRRQCEDKTAHLRRRWRIANHMYRGNSVANVWGLEDVHVPEIYKGIETLIPRLEESVLQYDPFFNIAGREQMDRMKQAALQAWYEWLFDQARIKRMIQPMFRSMLIYQFAMFKTWWALETNWQVTKEIIPHYGPHGVEYEIRRKFENIVTYDGPKSRIVDPYDAIVDTAHGEAADMLYSGDTTHMTYGQIMDTGEKMGWKNLEKLKDVRPSIGMNSTSDYDKFSRSMTERFAQGRRPPTGSPEIYKVTNLWGKMKFLSAHSKGHAFRGSALPGPDIDETEVSLTVIEDALCVEARENFHDDKHRPYAFARCAKEDWDFFNVGIIDHALPINANLDQHRALALEAHKLSQCPLVFAEDDSDLPESMLGVRPGTVFRSIGKVTFGVVPDTLQSVPMIEGMLKNDIVEVMGAPKIFEGTSTGESTTATEIERKIEEANRRVRGIVLSASMCIEDLLSQYHALSRQFVTSRLPFRVLGKAGKRLLGQLASITPMDLHHQVDFKMVGVAGLHTMGTRASAMTRYMNIAEPMIQRNPNVVDEPLFLRDLYELTVGMRPGEEVVRVPTQPYALVTAEEESMMFAMGQEVPIDDGDDDEQHLETHVRQLTEGDLPGMGEQYLADHILKHAEALDRKAREEEIMQKQLEQQAARDPRMAGGSPQKITEKGPGQTTGQNPGPDSADKFGTPGKKTPMMQTDDSPQAGAA